MGEPLRSSPVFFIETLTVNDCQNSHCSFQLLSFLINVGVDNATIFVSVAIK